jgi:hypothetical protein
VANPSNTGFSTGTESAAHIHAYSFTRSAENANHTHNYSFTTSTGSADGSEAQPEAAVVLVASATDRGSLWPGRRRHSL